MMRKIEGLIFVMGFMCWSLGFGWKMPILLYSNRILHSELFPCTILLRIHRQRLCNAAKSMRTPSIVKSFTSNGSKTMVLV